MLKLFARILRKRSADPTRKGEAVVADEHAHFYQGLAMTEELREALFPKTPQMISAIFERPLPPLTRPPEPAPSNSGSFPIIF